MRYAVQHALMQAQYACAKCMRTTATWHSPKIKVHDEPTTGFPSTRSWKRLLKLLRSQARLETNTRDRWQNHSQPAKGPGVRCIRYQGCTHVWQFPRATDMTDNWEKLCLLLCYLLNFSWSHCINDFATSRDHCTCSYSSI